jgi:hypothetical protein
MAMEYWAGPPWKVRWTVWTARSSRGTAEALARRPRAEARAGRYFMVYAVGVSEIASAVMLQFELGMSTNRRLKTQAVSTDALYTHSRTWHDPSAACTMALAAERAKWASRGKLRLALHLTGS